MWRNIVKIKHDLKKKKIKHIQKEKQIIYNNINTPNDFFEMKYSGKLINFFIYLEEFFYKNYVLILNKNKTRKEYDFIELIKDNVYLENKEYKDSLELLESDDDLSDHKDILY